MGKHLHSGVRVVGIVAASLMLMTRSDCLIFMHFSFCMQLV